LPGLPPESVDRRLAWAARLQVLLVHALPALRQVLAARMVVLLAPDLAGRELPAMARAFLGLMGLLPAAISRGALRLRPVLRLAATVAMAMVAGGIGPVVSMPPMAVRTPPATMAATTFPRTGEVPIGAFSSAIEAETAA
jgi:hypothetical protein